MGRFNKESKSLVYNIHPGLIRSGRIMEDLPGMILQLDINDGKRTITATAIDQVLTDPAILIKPKEGKKVSAERV